MPVLIPLSIDIDDIVYYRTIVFGLVPSFFHSKSKFHIFQYSTIVISIVNQKFHSFRYSSFNSIGLYSTWIKLQLHLKSITEEFKGTKVSQHLMLRDSKDEIVVLARVEIRTGRKWSTRKTIGGAESCLRHSEIVGRVAAGRHGLDVTDKWGTTSAEGKRHLVQREVRTMEEEARMVKAVGMKKEGSWLNWEGVRPVKLGWNDIWKLETSRLHFKLKAVLPNPSNLATWGLSEDLNCV